MNMKFLTAAALTTAAFASPALAGKPTYVGPPPAIIKIVSNPSGVKGLVLALNLPGRNHGFPDKPGFPKPGNGNHHEHDGHGHDGDHDHWHDGHGHDGDHHPPCSRE